MKSRAKTIKYNPATGLFDIECEDGSEFRGVDLIVEAVTSPQFVKVTAQLIVRQFRIVGKTDGLEDPK